MIEDMHNHLSECCESSHLLKKHSGTEILNSNFLLHVLMHIRQEFTLTLMKLRLDLISHTCTYLFMYKVYLSHFSKVITAMDARWHPSCLIVWSALLLLLLFFFEQPSSLLPQVSRGSSYKHHSKVQELQYSKGVAEWVTNTLNPVVFSRLTTAN